MGDLLGDLTKGCQVSDFRSHGRSSGLPKAALSPSVAAIIFPKEPLHDDLCGRYTFVKDGQVPHNSVSYSNTTTELSNLTHSNPNPYDRDLLNNSNPNLT